MTSLGDKTGHVNVTITVCFCGDHSLTSQQTILYQKCLQEKKRRS